MRLLRPVLACLLALSPLAATPAPAADIARFDKFARENAVFCAQGSSRQCYQRIFVFADRDGDGELSLAELEAVQQAVLEWTKQNRERLSRDDRRGILAALAVVEIAGLSNLLASYDTDGNGKLSQQELAADIRLDDRPVPVLVNDPEAIDWVAFRGRLGAAGPLLDSMLPH